MEQQKTTIAYKDKSYAEKRRILREYGIKDSIRDAVADLADAILKSENIFSLELDDYFSKDEKIIITKTFDRIKSKLFNTPVCAWNDIQSILIDGFIANEIIWDNDKHSLTNNEIIGFSKMNPESLITVYDKDSDIRWIQYPDDVIRKRIFTDSQIIFISSDIDGSISYNEISYVESLIKPYNLLTLMENACIMHNVNNATQHKTFKIPTKGMSSARADKQLGDMIAAYAENVNWDDSMGELTINGSKHLSFNKEYFLSSGDSGDEELNMITSNIPFSIGSLEYFKEKFRITTRIPNKDNELEMKRFSKLISRYRTIFKEIITKPLFLELKRKYPEKYLNVNLNDLINIRY